MKCSFCGSELNGSNTCPNCGQSSKVEILSKGEADAFQGVTIEDESNSTKDVNYGHDQYYDEASFRNRHRRTGGFRVYTMNSTSVSRIPWWQKLLIAGGTVAIIAFLVFVALPFIIGAIGVGIAIWLIFKVLFK